MSAMYFDSNNYLTPTPAEGKPASMHDSARGSPEPTHLDDQEALDGFHQLVCDINNILGPCNGIDSAGVDVGELKFVLRDYKSNEAEWSKYAFADYGRAYTRNLVDRGNGKCNMVSVTRLVCEPHGVLRVVSSEHENLQWTRRRIGLSVPGSFLRLRR